MNEEQTAQGGQLDVSIVALALVWKLQGLTATEKLVLLALADYCNEQFRAWPTVGSLATKTSLSRAAIHKALRSLKAQGLVEYTPRKDDHGNTSNLYAISRDALEKGKLGVHQKQEGVHEVHEGVSQVYGGGIPETGGGYTTCTEGVHHVYPEPSSYPPIDPPVEAKSGSGLVEPLSTGKKFLVQEALAILFAQVPEMKPARTYKDRYGQDISTGLPSSSSTAFLNGFVELAKADPPASPGDFLVLAEWVKAGGLFWMQSKSGWLAYLCSNLPQLLDRAMEWDRAGRPDAKAKPSGAPGWRPDPTIGSNERDYARETQEWIDKQS